MRLPPKLPRLAVPWLLAPWLLIAGVAPPADTAPAPAPTPAPRSPPALVKVELSGLGVRFSALDSPPDPKNSRPFFLGSAHGTVEVAINTNTTLASSIKGYQNWGANRGLKSLTEKKVSENEWVVEYSGGSLGGEKMHTYGRALYANGTVYFPAATATEKEWALGGDKLKACVDSFELMPAPGDPPSAGKAANPGAGKMEFPQAGFRIAPCDGATDSTAHHAILAEPFEYAGIDAVSFSVEAWTRTLAEYIAEDRERRSFLPGAIIFAKFLNPNTWVMETDSGEYARCVLANGSVYTAKAILPPPLGDKAWPGLAARARECVDSLEAIAAPPKIPAPNPAPALRSPGYAKLDFPKMGIHLLAFDAPPSEDNPWPLTWNSGNGSVRIEISLNINSMADYITTVKGWGANRGLTVLLDKNVSPNEWVLDCGGGSTGGEKMHAYVHAFFENGIVYAAHAIATEKQWTQGGAKLKACADSLELLPKPSPTPSAGSTTAEMPPKAEFPLGGFRIAPLDEIAMPGERHGILTTTYGTKAGAGFRVATISYAVEGWTKSMAEFVTDFKKRIPGNGTSKPIIAETFPTPNSWVVEPAVVEKMHFVMANGQMFSATQGMPYDQMGWPEQAAMAKTCLESMEAMETLKKTPDRQGSP